MEFLTTAALSASAAVLLVQQILKLQVVPIAFANRFPVFTNIVLSVVATLLIVRPSVDPSNWVKLLLQVGTVAVVAAITYNQLVGRSDVVKSLEGEGK